MSSRILTVVVAVIGLCATAPAQAAQLVAPGPGASVEGRPTFEVSGPAQAAELDITVASSSATFSDGTLSDPVEYGSAVPTTPGSTMFRWSATDTDWNDELSEPWHYGTYYWQVTEPCGYYSHCTGSVSTFTIVPRFKTTLDVVVADSVSHRLSRTNPKLYLDVGCSRACTFKVAAEGFLRRGKRFVRAPKLDIDTGGVVTKNREDAYVSLAPHVPARGVRALRAAGTGRYVIHVTAQGPESKTAAITRSYTIRPYKADRPAGRSHPKPKRKSIGQKIRDAVASAIARRYEMAPDGLSCHRLTTNTWRCDFHGLTRMDVSEGNVDGHSGTAYATRYPYGIDVRFTSYRWGGNAG